MLDLTRQLVTQVSASAFLLAFPAAWIHGLSNVFVGGRREPEAAYVVLLLAGVVAFAVLEFSYFALLAAAHRLSEVSLVYPVARGVAPVLVLLGAIHFVGSG